MAKEASNTGQDTDGRWIGDADRERAVDESYKVVDRQQDGNDGWNDYDLKRFIDSIPPQ
ncbi:hypothetical protein HY090_01850 [Candidatus Kaiserbacteria bacterium]|nr:hypothetical protein [Candidatus Kaiserbacteria bacterium]